MLFILYYNLKLILVYSFISASNVSFLKLGGEYITVKFTVTFQADIFLLYIYIYILFHKTF